MGAESKESRRERILGVDREVPCQILPGMFEGEIAVVIELPDGDLVSGYFDELYASWEGELDKEKKVEGVFGVSVVEESEDTFLIQLTSNPGRHLIVGSPRARVPKDFLLPKRE